MASDASNIGASYLSLVAALRTISLDTVTETVRDLCIEVTHQITPEMERGFQQAKASETSETGREILSILLENADLARKEMIPLCQDTGVTVVFVELGEEVKFDRPGLTEAITEGVRRGYKEGYMRASMVADPLRRKNTGDNTPPMVHLELVPGERFTLMVGAKGTGSENRSAMKMLTPAEGVEGVKRFVLKTVANAGPDACPPFVVGVGIGGNFEHSTYLAKRAVYRDLGSHHSDPFYADLERDLHESINALGIGPQGMGGRTTALAVHVETAPCHIGALPVAVNIDCHSHRSKRVAL